MWLELEAGRKRQRSAYERDVMLAWATEFMARQKVLGPKSLQALLGTLHKRQNLAEQRAAIDAIRAQYNMKVKTRK